MIGSRSPGAAGASGGARRRRRRSKGTRPGPKDNRPRPKDNRPRPKDNRPRPKDNRPRRRGASYARELRAGLRQWLPWRGLPLQSEDRRVTWTPRLLAICALLMALSQAASLQDRFADARLATVQMYPSRRRPGGSYEGFIATLAKRSAELMELVCQSLRRGIRQMAQQADCWTVEGWLLFGVDGTRVECPMTAANETALKCAGRSKSAPQQYLTMLLHLGSGLPWAFVRGPGTSSERKHLGQMLPLLPAEALLVADAGFVGYETLKSILEARRQFVIRVGANVKLLRELGYAREREGIVYLWPWARQRRGKDGRLPRDLARHASKVDPPLTLRLSVVHDGRQAVYLLSSVLEAQALSDPALARIYRRRWGLELYWRSLKQTLGRRRMLSDRPEHAQVELDWSMLGLWALGAMTVQALIDSGQPPGQASVAQALRTVRRAMQRGNQRWRRGALAEALAQATQDRYPRAGSKRSRHRKTKKTQRPPGAPQLLLASAAEKQLACELQRLSRLADAARSSPAEPGSPAKRAARTRRSAQDSQPFPAHGGPNCFAA